MEQMDIKILELLEQSLFERTQVAYERMMADHPRLKETAHEVAGLSEEIEQNKAMDTGSRELMKRFLSLSKEADYEYQKYLYIQGARDCVAILRELGVIK
ncbi:hypothetical protein [Sinanaerobacter chloroacetimidivorans]|uniref:Uncharacterized protein n=1 Tax=Sinanaerobacter chloroacetimidivorans TaxID=2818044 RepID=A0A8J8B2W0_9FIRM|nr:hypothetical protein [Sinanaerobacter chloroacetimidivorans]MBR0597655.1 hypothetical protein [Sinanaerobacter chloroacetimidivorans]